MNITLSIDDQVVAKARHIASVRGTSLSQLARAALNANCATLHSEDMSSGQRIESLAISNPFAVPHGT